MIHNAELELAEPPTHDIMPMGWVSRLLYLYIMVFIPFMSFNININEKLFHTRWQAGPKVYAEIMLSGQVTPYFVPFMLWPIVSIVLLLYDANRYANYFWVRWGIYSGVIVGLQYSLLLSGLILGVPIIIGLITYPFIVMGAYLIDVFLMPRNTPQRFMVSATVLVLLGIWGASPANILLFMLLAWGFFISLFSGPIWCTCLTLTISQDLYKRYDKTQLSLLQNTFVAWLSGYGLACFTAILKTLEVYNALPETPPPPSRACYIATAAAQGHPKLVGSRPVLLGDGRVMGVNHQLQYLKAGELMLLALWPRGHHQVRRVYDVIGPKIARRLRHPILADMAYLSLLPLEWGVRGLLFFSPQLNALAQQLYLPKQK